MARPRPVQRPAGTPARSRAARSGVRAGPRRASPGLADDGLAQIDPFNTDKHR
ncbi:hypothetical protein [Streptomyces rubiginosohelvolus]|uniref:hypothetical protein n=1 Tax=Streptomyces rubiginosohelvolus TaxID=67362 RepID=UPI0033E0B28E